MNTTSKQTLIAHAIGVHESMVKDACDEAEFASIHSDQYNLGEPGHADPKTLRWFEVAEYPISRLRDAVDADWFRSEQQMWADEGEPDCYNDMLNNPIHNPVIIFDDGEGGWTWDGNHRIGATKTKGQETIWAIVGVRQDVLSSPRNFVV